MTLKPLFEPGPDDALDDATYIAQRIEKLRASGRLAPEPEPMAYVEPTGAWRARACGAPPTYEHCSRANWRGKWPLPDWLGDIPGGDPWCIVLFGKPGCGKTHAATALFDSILAHWRTMRGWWVNFPEALREMRTEMNQDSPSGRIRSIDKLNDPRLVLVDDLGAVRETPYTVEAFRDLVMHRHARRMPTIITANAESMDDFAKIDERVASRLSEGIRVLLTGPDKRLRR